MKNWTSLDGTPAANAKLHELLDRAVRRKGLLRKKGAPQVVSMARYYTDGITTIAAVTITSFSRSQASHGYGVSALSSQDKPNEKYGAWIAVSRALDTAVNAYFQTYMKDKSDLRGRDRAKKNIVPVKKHPQDHKGSCIKSLEADEFWDWISYPKLARKSGK